MVIDTFVVREAINQAEVWPLFSFLFDIMSRRSILSGMKGAWSGSSQRLTLQFQPKQVSFHGF